MPASKVTACTLGGADLDQLFITTSRENLEPGGDPLAGSLFRAAVGGYTGQPAADVGVAAGSRTEEAEVCDE